MVLKIRLALLQMKVVDDKSANIEQAKRMISAAGRKGADLVILPEMFNCPYETAKFSQYAELKDNSLTLKSLAPVCRDNKVHCVAGSIPEISKGKIYNTSFIFDDKGKILGFHRKMHLFDIDVPGEIYFKESDVLSAGNKVTVIETDLGKIGIAICYDLRFPELARLMTLKGAGLLVYPGAFNLNTGPVHWKTLLRTRAIDNQVFVAGASPARDHEASYVAYGHSLVSSPWGDVIVEAGSQEEILYVDLNLDDEEKIRTQLPLLKNRRNDIYCLTDEPQKE